MHHLLELPTEILLWIYHSQDNIDDALHLARTCKRLHTIFDPPLNRVAIFRSVIKNASHHQYDAQISYFQDLNESLRSFFHGDLLIGFPRPSDQVFAHVDSLRDKEISDSVVWTTVCRWHGVKVLFQLYSDSSVHASYVNSTPPRSQFNESDKYRNQLAAEAPLARPSCTGCLDFQRLDSTRRAHAYERFYQALTSHWVSVETLCLARLVSYRSTSEQHERFDTVWELWTNNPTRSLQEKIDVLEVSDFVWCFLGRKILQEEDVILKWLGDTDYFEEYHDPHEPIGTNWMHFVRNVIQFLRPPHIIELLIRVVWDPLQAGMINKSEYLGQLGFFEEETGVVEREDTDEWAPDSSLSFSGLEEDVGHGLAELENAGEEEEEEDSESGMKWEKYRNERWAGEMRGRLLFREETSEQLFERITHDDR